MTDHSINNYPYIVQKQNIRDICIPRDFSNKNLHHPNDQHCKSAFSDEYKEITHFAASQTLKEETNFDPTIDDSVIEEEGINKVNVKNIKPKQNNKIQREINSRISQRNSPNREEQTNTMRGESQFQMGNNGQYESAKYNTNEQKSQFVLYSDFRNNHGQSNSVVNSPLITPQQIMKPKVSSKITHSSYRHKQPKQFSNQYSIFNEIPQHKVQDTIFNLFSKQEKNRVTHSYQPSPTSLTHSSNQPKLPKDFKQAQKVLAKQIMKATLEDQENVKAQVLLVKEQQFYDYNRDQLQRKPPPQLFNQQLDSLLHSNPRNQSNYSYFNQQSSKLSTPSLTNRSPDGGSSTCQRLYEFGSQKNSQRRLQVSPYEEEQLKQCSFKPQLVTKKIGFDQRRRSIDEFYTDQTRQIKILQQRREEAENQHLQEELEEKKKVSSTFEQYKNYYQKVKQNFFAQSCEKKKKKDLQEEPTFHPSINKRSQKLKRNSSVGDELYLDAQKRMESLHAARQRSMERENEKFTNATSDKKLAEKLHKEFEEICLQLNVLNDVDFKTYKTIMENLGFYCPKRAFMTVNEKERQKNSKFYWEQTEIQLIDTFKLISQISGQTLKVSVKILIFSLSNLYFPWMSTIKPNYYEPKILESSDYRKTSSLIPKIIKIEDLDDDSLKLPHTFPTEENCQKDQQARQKLEDTDNTPKEQIFMVKNAEEAKKLMLKFFQLVSNRKQFLQKQKSESQKRNLKNEKMKRKGSLVNLRSEKIAQKVKEDYQNQMKEKGFEVKRHHEILLKKGEDYRNKVLEQQKQNQNKQMDQCTFKPQISKLKQNSIEEKAEGDSKVFDNLYRQAKKRHGDKSPDEIEWEKAKNECIFQPNKELRERQKQQQQQYPYIKKKSSSEINIVDQEQVEAYLQSVFSDKSQKYDDLSSDSPTPILFLDVNLCSKGELKRITIFEGDDAFSVAHKFCQQNGLDERKRDKLVTVISNQLKTLLPKIEEEHEH